MGTSWFVSAYVVSRQRVSDWWVTLGFMFGIGRLQELESEEFSVKESAISAESI